MSFFEQLIERLTDVYKKTANNNIGKIIKLLSDELDAIQQSLDTIELWRGIDNAEGTTLDLIGENIGQQRLGLSDAAFRLRIKTKIKANTSRGDIETLNEVLRTFLSDSFIGIQEMWSINDPLIERKSAEILIQTRIHEPFPNDVIGRVAAAGIGIWWHIIFEPQDFAFKREITQGKSEFIYSGELYCGPVYDRNTLGVSISSVCLLTASYPKGEYIFPVVPNYAGEITSSTSGIRMDGYAIVQQNQPTGLGEWKYAGEEWNKGITVTTTTEITQQNNQSTNTFKYAGEFYSGGGD
ncbi:hypothetical protein P9848_05625 [Geobacillus stearothermophilus]|uniref:hypothetical protein n=1 Tax=Geobacillus stearothermophilus TaxID=1422 RepID=UPI002E1F7DAC|nr:hypothetical protein [Geobacillus stearothermophilus]